MIECSYRLSSPNYLLEYFNIEALFRLAKVIGRLIKMDINISETTRSYYARVCIEIDTSQTFMLCINNLKQEIAYEINACLCNKCGKISNLPKPIVNLKVSSLQNREQRRKMETYDCINQTKGITISKISPILSHNFDLRA